MTGYLIQPCSLALVVALCATVGCAKRDKQPEQSNGNPAPASEREVVEDAGGLFVDRTHQLGITPPTGDWPDGEYMTPEITPGGIAVIDFNGDGRLDLYQVNHCAAGSFTNPGPNRLFQQQPDGTFTEVPDAAGLADPGFGHGVAVGDIDNDGDPDVLVTNYGPNALYVNEGGKFVNRTEPAGISGDYWSSSAGFLDYDRDGDLDIYIANFATFDPDRKCVVGDNPNDLDYCGPHTFDSLSDTLYRNNGDGTFTDVSNEAGIVLPGRGWGIACADVTGDGWCDVYVANDEEPAQLWVNQQDGTFEEEAVFRGCAYNMSGRVEAGMGVGIADIDGDLRYDLFKTHLGGETNTLYLSGGEEELYSDQTTTSTMGAVDRPYTGWGCGFFDFDHDGNLDLAIANGRVSKGVPHPASRLGKFWSRYAEPNLLFTGDGHGRFANVSNQAGAFGKEPLSSRGMAIADLDGDGDLDMAVQQLNNELRVYLNEAPKEGAHWLIVRTLTGPRDAYGARVYVRAGEKQLLRLAHPASSYLTSNDPRAHFGLGAIEAIDEIIVDWPSGVTERFPAAKVDQIVVVTEGEGQPIENGALRRY